MTIADHRESELRALFDAIAARDRPAVARLFANSPSVVRRALSRGATRDDASPFFEAIGHYAYAGDTPLHLAAAAQAPDIAADLLAGGAEVRARNRRGAEPLHYAADGVPGSAQWNPQAQAAVVELLLAAGADPNAKDKSGVAPLHRAVRTRCTAAVRALLVGGAAPRLKNKSGSTPLHLAVQATGRGGAGHPEARAAQAEIIELLLGHGARWSDQNGAGKSVRECAPAPWRGALREGG
jgi:Ankyrin repeats (3 copies)/Ankyrin repeat